MSDVYFEQVEDGHFIGQPPARGPWDAGACHAGPVAGLVARACEHAVPGKMLTRLTLNLTRPTPMSGFSIDTEVDRDGRSVSTCRFNVITDEGKVCISGTSMHLSTAELEAVPTTSINTPDFEKAKPTPSPLAGSVHGQKSFGHFIEAAMETGTLTKEGPKQIWMKTPPLLAGETTSPLQSICPLADSGNGLSRNGDLGRFSFLNADLTIHFHRAPVSDWLHSNAISHWQSTGIGLAQSVISDTEGPVATALQTLLIRPI